MTETKRLDGKCSGYAGKCRLSDLWLLSEHGPGVKARILIGVFDNIRSGVTAWKMLLNPGNCHRPVRCPPHENLYLAIATP
jgi:hypothetical protein